MVYKTTVTKYTDTCLSYFRYLIGKDGQIQGPDTMVSVSEVDTSSKYFRNAIHLKTVGITQDSGKLQLMLNGTEVLADKHTSGFIDEPFIEEERDYEVAQIYNSSEIKACVATLERLNITIAAKTSESKKLERASDSIFNNDMILNDYSTISYDSTNEKLVQVTESKRNDSTEYSHTEREIDSLNTTVTLNPDSLNYVFDSISKLKIVDSINDIDTISDAEKKFLIHNLYHPFYLIEVDSTKDSCKYCGLTKVNNTDSIIKIGAYLYKKSAIWKIPSLISKEDSVNNFYLFIKKRYKVNDPIYFYRVPFARWEAGAVNIPFQFTPGYKNVALNNITTSFVNVNAFIGRAWGNTKFYYDPTKTHTGFTGMLAVFAGVGQLPTLAVERTKSGLNYAYNLAQQDSALGGTSQLGFSFGFAATVTIDIFNLGIYVGNTMEIGSGELNQGWYDENKWWVGFGIGLNLGIFNNALTNAWE